MRILLLLVSALLLQVFAHAQEKDEFFDFFFNPTKNAPRYYGTTVKQNGRWNRKAWFLPERGMAMEGWYSDESCKTPHGEFIWYHPNRAVRERGTYANGKKQGTWIRYDENGNMLDSSNFEAGIRKGVSLGWYPSGAPSDSSHFDGAGRGTIVEWYENGTLRSSGHIINDTAKNGAWKYYHPNGAVLATEEYVAGNRTACACFTEGGKQLKPENCVEQDADFRGGEQGWIQFLQRNLKASVPVKNDAPFGIYQVVVQFVVAEDGTISDIKPLTRFGYGMEEEVVRMLNKSPKWIPAHQFGKKVKAYRRQPVSFSVEKG